MQEYKQQLLRLLVEHGWELVERVDGEKWWLEEAWKVRSKVGLLVETIDAHRNAVGV